MKLLPLACKNLEVTNKTYFYRFGKGLSSKGKFESLFRIYVNLIISNHSSNPIPTLLNTKLSPKV